jgi:hypothetical protein
MHQCLVGGDGKLAYQRDYLPLGGDVDVAHYAPSNGHYVHSSHEYRGQY